MGTRLVHMSFGMRGIDLLRYGLPDAYFHVIAESFIHAFTAGYIGGAVSRSSARSAWEL